MGARHASRERSAGAAPRRPQREGADWGRTGMTVTTSWFCGYMASMSAFGIWMASQRPSPQRISPAAMPLLRVAVHIWV